MGLKHTDAGTLNSAQQHNYKHAAADSQNSPKQGRKTGAESGGSGQTGRASGRQARAQEDMTGARHEKEEKRG